MSRREWLLRKECIEPGCREFVVYRYDRLRDRTESFEMKRDWRCSRHLSAETILSRSNPAIEKVMVSTKSAGCGEKLYWDHHGFRHGPGFKVWADDFPEGTKLIVTARIELP